MLGQQLVNGLVLGSVYALSALGFTLVFGAARVVNFAYGEIVMLGAFATLTLMSFLHLDFFVALPLAMLVMAAVNVGVYLVTIRPVLRGTELQVILVTTGLIYILREFALLVWGSAPRPIEMGVSGIQMVGDIVVTNQRLIVIAITLLLVLALYGMLYQTRIGKALRAVAQNRGGAEAIGLNVDRIVAFTFAVSGAFACAAGGLLGSLYAAEPSMGGIPLLKAFVIVIFGGLGSVPGAIAGGLIIGLTETLTGSYISFAFKDVFTFLILIAVLLLRPAGLLGRSIS